MFTTIMDQIFNSLTSLKIWTVGVNSTHRIVLCIENLKMSQTLQLKKVFLNKLMA